MPITKAVGYLDTDCIACRSTEYGVRSSQLSYDASIHLEDTRGGAQGFYFEPLAGDTAPEER
jgi:hypothetical protein